MYLADTSGVNNNFVNFAHFAEELFDTWAFQDICVMPLPLDFDRDREVMLWHQLQPKG